MLVNLLLATVDRWLALTYPLVHRERVTVRLVISVQLTCFTAVVAGWTLPYVLGFVELPRCAVNPIFLEWVSASYVLYALHRTPFRSLASLSLLLRFSGSHS